MDIKKIGNRIVYFSFLILTFMSFISRPKCKCGKLEDGKYNVKFKQSGFNVVKYKLLIKEKDFIQYIDGKEIKGKIIENEDCALSLDYLINPDSLSGLQKLLFLHSNKPYYEFKDTRTRKIKFRLTGFVPHATAGEGKFIRTKNK